MSRGTGELALAEVDELIAQETAQEPREPALTVGVVAYEMEGQATGVGRYLEGLLTGAAAWDPPWRWVLFFKGEPFDHPLWADLPALADVEAEPPPIQPIFDHRPDAPPILWEQFRLPRLLRRQHLDVLFSPSYSLPAWPRLPALVTIHDLAFEHLPEAFPFRERHRRRLLARRAVRQAKRVLADTERIADELVESYRLPRSKIAVVPLAVDERFRRAPADPASLAPIGVEPPYLLALGTILARRRLDLVLEAFAEVAAEHPDLRLVLAGRNRLREPAELERWIARSGVGPRVTRLGWVDEEHLPALYRHAEGSFYLSTYEGYGLPPLESLAAGTPAIVAPGLGLDDLWPDYPYRAARLDRATVSAVLRRLLHDEIERHRVARAGVERLAELTWAVAARRFIREVERALVP